MKCCFVLLFTVLHLAGERDAVRVKKHANNLFIVGDGCFVLYQAVLLALLSQNWGS